MTCIAETKSEVGNLRRKNQHLNEAANFPMERARITGLGVEALRLDSNSIKSNAAFTWRKELKGKRIPSSVVFIVVEVVEAAPLGSNWRQHDLRAAVTDVSRVL
ncbi:uncharacterized protein STEHIDRAFT_160053 [Stereum hirsutum FP-91666 SS1]|uniref:uncharacterized protein n=1 Tax=Stereum hirsutum (strain FP-91666) TaxID=721885 RepID=UPI00044496A3|nr:uncharacterized protein STEHIDRAFT_160053 [Stereum hirsutum FP-91666 SS1]EIM83472.1 hypothetical protein STEHIDRAFT_160053 [Stereum hirsutum FP-91666 SS1]